MFKSLLALVLAVGLVHVAVAAGGNCRVGHFGPCARDWQMGKLLDSNRILAPPVVFAHFQIEGETLVYVASERLTWRWSKAANLTINGPVKFAVEKRKLFVIDEDGKEHEMEIVSKTLRQSGEPPKQ